MQVVDVTWKALPKRVPRRPRTWSTAKPSKAQDDSTSLPKEAISTPTNKGPASKPQAIRKGDEGKHWERKYEYLDHTADVQIHSWGDTLEESFAQAAIGMFGYMTDLERIEMMKEVTVEAEGHDMESLVFNFLDECLYEFGGDGFIMKRVEVENVDRKFWKVKAKAWGETFDRSKHTQGTEVKAITYSNLQVIENEEKDEKKAEIFVIVDI
eukprot:Plantae.Rhodophyta-Hildenbrandia_rubra.ctg18796.p1 GENE.Plantae.Rhodophyta-Hildenbrandia_rubra.ctg18796~~Plantae.Rhodophyta-Hildenbrandia_rubra.ctg18796.p1  ORF type:complete len:211 (-),score=50.67 Plantae.Rhodophyta-Hildenbrandia_rubra.ctg18796:279-911(-)